MSDKLRCEIVQDLLPSYVDGLTSDETNEAIKDHLADCVSCRDMYERMKADETSAEENSEVMEKEKKEINFLKKIKQKHRLNLMLVVVILTVFFAAVYYHQTYQKGEEMAADEIDYSLQWNSNDSQLNILGNFKNANRGYTRLIGEEDEDGITHLKIYSSPVGSRHPNQFVAGYSKVNAADQVWLGDRIIWDQGENISKMTSDLYQAKTPPISMIMLPHGREISIPAPRAAAIGSSIIITSLAPASSAACQTAFFSTSVAPLGTPTQTRGRFNVFLPIAF